MFKSLLTNMLAATAALFPIASASASGPTDPLAEWVAQVNRQIDYRMLAPMGNKTGVARIAFRRGADGRATDIVARGGPHAIADAGVRTAKRLRDLPPLPTGMPADQRIVMNFLIGGPGMSVPYDLQRERLLASANTSNTRLASIMGGTKLAMIEKR